MANAQLVAAAPDLLGACKRFLLALERSRGSVTGMFAEFRAVEEIAEVAIAKAEQPIASLGCPAVKR